jgi:glutamine synthetase
VNALVKARENANKIESEYEKAVKYQKNVFPFFEKIRSQVDSLELIVDDELWPLPKYRELLFIR